jgi:lycopene cyclase domain-containing protein
VGELTYLALLAGCLVVTAPLELVLEVRVYARWRRLLLAVLPTFAVFVAWVLYAIAQGHWSYDGDLTLGVRLPGGIPVEEVLFFLVVPLCSVLALEAVRKVTGWNAGYPASPDDSRGSIAARRPPTASEHRSEGRARSGASAEAVGDGERGADRGAESGNGIEADR